MHIIIIAVIVIIIFLWVKSWIEDHLPQAIILGVFLAAWFFLGILKAVILTAALLAVGALIFAISKWIRKSNEKKLKRYLEAKCRSLGYMTPEQWKKQLPQYEGRSYLTSFSQITNSFAREMEKRFFIESKDLSWVDPYVDYLLTNIMGSVYELEKIPNPAMQNTHCSPDAKLIYTALSGLAQHKRIDGAPVLEKISLDATAVRPFLPDTIDEDIPEYYLISFKLCDSFVESRKISSDSFESEEISLDDLESLV